MTGVAVLTVVLVLAPLVAIFGYLVYRGVGSINWAFLTQTPKPVGEPGGGMANAIVGSVLILGIASVIGVPFGIGAGIYLAEFGRNRFGSAIRFTADVLNGVPSIVIGIVAWAILVRGRGFLGACGRRGAGDHDGPDHLPDHRRDAAAGAASAAGSSVRTRRPALADDAFDHSAHRDFGRDHRSYAGFCPSGGRNRTLAFHRSGQHVLESALRSADGRAAAADLCVRQFAL